MSNANFAAGLTQGIGNALLAKQQRDQQDKLDQQKTAMDAITLLMNSGRVNDPSQLGPLWSVALGTSGKKGKGGKPDPVQAMIDKFMGPAIKANGTAGQPAQAPSAEPQAPGASSSAQPTSLATSASFTGAAPTAAPAASFAPVKPSPQLAARIASVAPQAGAPPAESAVPETSQTPENTGFWKTDAQMAQEAIQAKRDEAEAAAEGTTEGHIAALRRAAPFARDMVKNGDAPDLDTAYELMGLKTPMPKAPVPAKMPVQDPNSPTGWALPYYNPDGSVARTDYVAAPSSTVTKTSEAPGVKSLVDAHLGVNGLRSDGTPETDPEKRTALIQASKDFIANAASVTAGRTTRNAEAAMNVPVPGETAVQAAARQGVSQTSLDNAAAQLHESGVTPTGFGMKNLRIVVMNREGELYGTEPLAANSATYKAYASSLVKQQQALTATRTFMGTVGKNLQIFLKQVGNLPDTGVPWLNAPVRTLDANVVGDANMPAILAARQIVNVEFAKINSGSNVGGGAALSDNARREAQSINPENATLPQILNVVNVLVQDGQNRIDSTQDGIDWLKDKLNAAGAMPGADTGAYRVLDPSGKAHYFDTQAQVDAFAKAVQFAAQQAARDAASKARGTNAVAP